MNSPLVLNEFRTELGWTGIVWQPIDSSDSANRAGNGKYPHNYQFLPQTRDKDIRNWSVARLTFGHRTKQDLLDHLQRTRRRQSKMDAEQSRIVEKIVDFAAGAPVELSGIPVVADGWTPFQRCVYTACRKVSWGTTLSYAGLAKMAGSPRAARAVGTVMANNKTPLLIPCHRIVASGGRLGGFTAPGGLGTKQRLLELEESVLGNVSAL